MSKKSHLSGTVARSVVELLGVFGVERVFGVPGIQNIELFDALADAPFETVTTTSESSAAFMADAHSRSTGKFGVLVVTAGPGLTNALTGIAEAFLDSSPMLIILSTGSRTINKKFQLHQIDQAALLKPIVKEFFQPGQADEVPKLIVRAVELLKDGEPGPAVVEIPFDFMMTRINIPFPEARERNTVCADGGQLDQAAKLLRESDSAGIYAGSGAFGASKELVLLSEMLQAPVATTISGRGVIPEDHPLCVGYGFGRSGNAVAFKTFRKVRTLLAVGCKYGEVATGSYGVKLPAEHIHVDINPMSLRSNYPATIAINLDAQIALKGLLDRLGSYRKPINRSLQDLILKCRGKSESEVFRAPLDQHSVRPSRFLRILRKKLGQDSIMVTDCGIHQFWAISDFPVYYFRSFITPTDFQSMGFSVPAAIAVKLARPDTKVVSLVGDGGFAMSGFECLTAVKMNIGIVVIVFADGHWGMIRDAQKRGYRRTPFTKIAAPDYKTLAESFGMSYVAIMKDAEIEEGIVQALQASGTCLVEVKVNYSESPQYVKGAGRQMFLNLPFSLKAMIAGRLIKRFMFRPIH